LVPDVTKLAIAAHADYPIASSLHAALQLLRAERPEGKDMAEQAARAYLRAIAAEADTAKLSVLTQPGDHHPQSTLSSEPRTFGDVRGTFADPTGRYMPDPPAADPLAQTVTDEMVQAALRASGVLNRGGADERNYLRGIIEAALRARESAPAQEDDDRITGAQWKAGREVFVIYADRYSRADSAEPSYIVADVAPAEIFKAMIEAAPRAVG
jgi:hypothetical protein